jgi:hypothetical protein
MNDMYYLPGQPVDGGAPSLRTALATIHRDRGWWHKMLVGGLLWITVLGSIMVEGYSLESLDNTRNGFPTPLPRWHDWGTKAVQGIFGVVIDFFYFVFPLLAGGVLWGCTTIMLVTFGAEVALRYVGLSIGIVVVVWIAVMWLAGVSPVAKQMFVNEGLPRDALSSKVLRTVTAAPARGMYLRARLHSAPLYVLAVAILAMAWYSQRWGVWAALLLLWLGLAALLYARLVTIQLYQAATKELERRRFQARRAART